jgi:hypothetical protein
VWERRIAIMATFAFVRAGDCNETLRLARVLLDDEHDLIHKAVGWMLREVGKRDEELLVGFLQQHAVDIPRTMLRYAVERLDARLRTELMAAGRRRTATVGDSDLGQNRSSPHRQHEFGRRLAAGHSILVHRLRCPPLLPSSILNTLCNLHLPDEDCA